MRYISLFTGIGGLESKDTQPTIICEKDPHCKKYLQRKFKSSDFVDDVKDLADKKTKIAQVDIVTGGWPCQDLSVAGEKKGFKGVKSVLFYDLLKVAQKAKCETVIAENVPNLLNIDNGGVFSTVLNEFADAGFKYIGWRVINTRSFNLPHQRRRLFIVASKSEQIAKNLFNPIQKKITKSKNKTPVNSFYHTAGTHSICFSQNYTPTLKVSGGGPAVQYNNIIRRISPTEALKLQGFTLGQFKDITDTQMYSMAGNAVSKPVGNFIFDSIEKDYFDIEWRPAVSGNLFGDPVKNMPSSIKNGFYRDGAVYGVDVLEENLCENLADFIDFTENSFLSNTAILGLLRRSAKARKIIEKSLLSKMIEIVSMDALLKEVSKEDVDILIKNSSKPNFKQKILNGDEEQLFF
jgi:DNA (cytosine-5)-methyltransferase 1